MIAYIFQTSVCLFGFYILYISFLQKETFFQFNRWYLIGTLIASMIIPFLPALFQQNEVIFSTGLEPVAISINDLSVSLTNSQNNGWHWTQFLLFIYSIGAVIQLMRLSKGLLDIRKLHLNSKIFVANELTLRLTKTPHLPFSFFKTIYFYQDHGMTDDELKKVITHESTHAKEMHSVDVLLLELVGCLLWLNPMIYLYRKLIKNIHEYLADASVLQHTPIKMYGQLLLSQKHSGLQLALANNFFHSQLKNRIDMMTRKRSKGWYRIKYLAILPIFIITVSLFSFTQKEQVTDAVDTILKEATFPAIEAAFTASQENEIKQPALVIANQEYDRKLEIQDVNPNLIKSTIYKSKANEEELATLGPRAKHGVTFLELLQPQELIAKRDTTPKREIFKVVEEMPRFPGCEDGEMSGADRASCAKDKMLRFIYTNIRYPALAREAGIQGRSVVQFVVNVDGTLTDAKILRDIGGGTADEVLSVIDKMNSMPVKWIPGKQRGKNVAVQYVLPISFKLDDEGENDEPIILVNGELYEKLNLNSDIDPNDIESVSVFKDESAKVYVEKYGEKALNGVVSIIMKNGKKFKVRKKEKKIGAKKKLHSDEPLFKVVEEMPRFPGCEDSGLEGQALYDCAKDAMLQYIYKNVRYPKESRKAGMEGMAVVQFVVSKDGSIGDIEVVRELDEHISDEVYRIIKSMESLPEKWVPGKQRGKNVNVAMTLPIRFKLEGSTKEDAPNNAQSKEKTDAVVTGVGEEYNNDPKVTVIGFGTPKSSQTKTSSVLNLEDFTIAPNPTSGIFNVQFKGDAGPIKFSIVNLSGEVLLQSYDNNFNGIFNQQIEMDNLSAGQYYFTIMQNGKSVSKSFQVQK